MGLPSGFPIDFTCRKLSTHSSSSMELSATLLRGEGTKRAMDSEENWTPHSPSRPVPNPPALGRHVSQSLILPSLLRYVFQISACLPVRPCCQPIGKKEEYGLPIFLCSIQPRISGHCSRMCHGVEVATASPNFILTGVPASWKVTI